MILKVSLRKQTSHWLVIGSKFFAISRFMHFNLFKMSNYVILFVVK